MLRRFIVIGLVLAVTVALMGVKNLVLTGEQDLYAVLDVDEQQGLVAAGDEVVVRFNDLAGNEQRATEAEFDQLRERLDGLHNHDRKSIPVVADSLTFVPGVKRIRFEVAEDTPMPDLRALVTNAPYHRSNPPMPIWHTPLGIDLRGGVEFRIALYDDDGARQRADDETVAILRKRLDARGLSEPQVSRLSNGDVQVVIPGGTQADAARTRKVLQTAGRLEFREVLAVFGNEGEGPSNEPGTKVIETSPGEYELDDYIGFDEVLYPAKPEYRGQKPSVFYRLGPARLTGSDVSNAYPTTHDGSVAVGIDFTTGGAAKNLKFTTDIRERGPDMGGNGSGRMAISLDGVVESAPSIRGASGSSSVIYGRFTEEEVNQLRTVLKAGSLSVTPVVLAERVVGPSLGAETVAKAGWAMAVALALIMVFMAVYYLRMGFVAVASLVATIGLIYGVLVVFGATLTLPGIAGLVLTVGMAVDANILIFERIREELRDDTDLASCIEAGYGRALGTIIDANVTTFLTALILYMIGSGPVQGFGLTLMIGIGTSMFGAIYVGRTITNLLYKGRDTARVPDYVGEINLPYTRWRWGAFVLSAVMVVAGFLEFFVWTSPNKNFDIDFTGGNMVQITFKQPKDLEAITTGLTRAAEAGNETLGPHEAQYQPYYPGFVQVGEASRQWMFKTRDEDAVALEAELADLEGQQNALVREAEGFRTQEVPEENRAQEAEESAAALQPRIDELRAAIAERTEVLVSQLRGDAFPGDIADDGSEVMAASLDGRELQIRLATLDIPDEASLVRMGEAVAASSGVESATVSLAESQPQDGAVLDVAVTFAQVPGSSNEFDLDIASAERLKALLAVEGRDEAVLNGVATAAFDIYATIDEAAAGERVRLAKPVPSQEHFSGLVANEMKKSAALALAIALLGILAYVAARFEFRYGVGAVIALFHDVPITLGLLALAGVRIDLTVVAGLLTIIGYSLNDTIVVFDRIRETRKLRPELSMAQAIDAAIAQTMSRTVLTTATTLGVVVILFFFGGDGVMSFSATLIIGLLLGTYSSVFIASPVLLLLDRRDKLGQAAAAAVEAEQKPDIEVEPPPVAPGS